MAEPASDLREVNSIGSETREWLLGPPTCPALGPLGIRLTGVSEARPGFRFVRRSPDMVQLLVTCAGSGRVLVDGVWHATEAGEGYLTPPGLPHAYHCPEGGEWLACWAMLGPEAVRGLPAAPLLVRLDQRPLHDAILNLHRESVGRADPALLRSWAELLRLLLQRALAGAEHDPRLRRLWETVDAHPGEAWPLERLAAEAGVGPEQLRRLCRRELGRSPVQQVTQLRMRRAAGLLVQGERVAEVAAAMGYDNAFAFSTAFRRVMGKPPSAIRGA